MTRRGFFKGLAGLVAGVYVAFVPKPKKITGFSHGEISDVLKKRSGTRPATKEEIVEFNRVHKQFGVQLSLEKL